MNAFSAFAERELWHIAGWTMLHYLWLGTLVGVMAILCRLLLRRAAASVRYATALACLILLATLPAGIATWLTFYPPPFQVEDPPWRRGARGGFDKPVASIELHSPESNSPTAHHGHEVIDLREQQEPPTVADAQAEVETEAANVTHSEPSPSPSLQGRGISVAALEACVPYLPWLWIIGTPITFALLAAGIVGTKRLQRASRTLDDGPVIELLSRLASSLHVARRVTVAICDRIASPVLVGIVRPIILLPPAAISGWSPDEIEMVLLHELAHVRRWDNLVNLVQRLIESLLFFHPAVWLVSTWVRRERETCCDAFVVRRTERPHAYAELLLNLAAVHPPLAGLAFARHPLRSRIRRILQLDDDPMLISGKSLALMLSTLFIAATLAVLYLPTIGQAEESATEVTEGTETKDLADEAPTDLAETTKSEVIEIESTPKDAQSDLLNREIAHLRDKKSALEIEKVRIQKKRRELVNQQQPDEENNKPNTVLQQMKEFDVAFSAVQKQIDAIDKELSESKLVLTLRNEHDNETPPKAESESDEPQVVATLPPNADELNPQTYAPPNDFIAAYKAAREKNLYVELLRRKDDLALIVVPQPNEANWPDVLGESPRKDRVIAEKAYARLGLKLAPFTRAEAKYREFTGQGPLGVMIVGGNVPKGLPLPSVLTTVGEHGITHMDDLLSWLESNEGRGTKSVKCFATADGNEYLFDASHPEPRATAPPPHPSDLKQGLKLLFFHASNSHPSSEMQQIAMKVVMDFPAAQLILVDAKDSPLAKKFGVDVVPTCLIVRDDKVLHRLVGLQSAEKLREALQDATKISRSGTPDTPAPSPQPPTELAATKTSRNETREAMTPEAAMAEMKRMQNPVATSRPQPAAPDRILVAYQIPPDLTQEIGKLAKTRHLQAVWDERNRFVVQASREDHARLSGILKETPKWRDPAAAQARMKQPLVMGEADGEPVLEWRSAGLTFKPETRRGYLAMELPGGVEVLKVAPGSPADWQSLRAGDSLASIEDFRIGSLEELKLVMDSLLEGFSETSRTLNLRFVREQSDNQTNYHLGYYNVNLPLRPDELAIQQAERNRAMRESDERTAREQAKRMALVEAERQRAIANPTPLPGSDLPPDATPGNENADPPAPPTETEPSALRYHGKSFDEWRAEWQTELSTEKRREAVKALSAFGRAGNGKEAAEAILDVAGEYDFYTVDESDEGILQKTVLNELAPLNRQQSMAQYWLPGLAARLEKDPKKWLWLATNLLQRLRTDDKDTIAILRSLAEAGPIDIRRAALPVLVKASHLQSGSAQIDDKTRDLLTASLKSEDPELILSALVSLVYHPSGGGETQLIFQPELVPLLFHANKNVQQQARLVIRHIQDDDAPQVVKSLLAILQDTSRKPDHLAAIRALGTIGPKAAAAQPQLEQIFAENSQDMPLLVATAFAVDRIEGGSRLHNKLNDIVNNAPDEKTQTKLIQLMNVEPQYFD